MSDQPKPRPTGFIASVGTVIETRPASVEAPRTLHTTFPETTAGTGRIGTLSEQRKEEFLAVLAHELRTPLHSVLGWAQILQRNISGRLKERALRAIESNARPCPESSMISPTKAASLQESSA